MSWKNSISFLYSLLLLLSCAERTERTSPVIKPITESVYALGIIKTSGGRVLEYLKHYIGDSRNTVLIIGFQAEGIKGRALLNKTHEVKIHGKYYPVKANVLEILGLSAHADQAELMNWIRKFEKRPKQIMLVHGEPCALEALRVKIQTELNLQVKIMKQNQDVLLFTCASYVVNAI